MGDLEEEGNDTVHNGAGGCKVVQRDEGIHLELGRAEQTLNHGQTNGLEAQTEDLVDEADHDEFDLTNGCNHDTDDDERDIAQGLHVWWADTKGPAGEENGNGGGGLEDSCQRA